MGNIDLCENVALSADRIFDTIMALEDYPDFVPYCSGLDVLAREELGLVEQVTARLHVQFGPISQAYTSDVKADRQSLNIHAHSTDGPFKELISDWQLRDREDGCAVHFTAQYTFKNPMIAAVAAKTFEQAQGQIMQAFIQRARLMA